MRKGNLFRDLPAAQQDEQVNAILSNPQLKIERIVSSGQASPDGFWYNQDQHEWVIVIQGSAVLCIRESGRKISMDAGDYIEIPAHIQHRVDWTDPDQTTIWLAVHWK